MVNQEQHHCFQTMDRPIAIDGGLAALRLGDLGMPHLTGSKLKTSCVENGPHTYLYHVAVFLDLHKFS